MHTREWESRRIGKDTSMRKSSIVLKTVLLAGAAAATAQPAHAQLITLGDVISALTNLDATVTLLGQDVAAIDLDTDANTAAIGVLNTQVLTNTGNIATLQTDLGALNGQVGTNTGNIATLQTDLGALTGQVGTNTGNIATLQTDLG